jgi:hypothetical protein
MRLYVYFAGLLLLGTIAEASNWDCKCANGLSAKHDYSGGYQSNFSISISDAGKFSAKTPCKASNISSRIVSNGKSIKLEVFRSDGKKIGFEEQMWDDVQRELAEQATTITATSPDGKTTKEVIPRKGRPSISLKFDPFLKHDATWRSKRTVLIPSQDVQAVVFCQESEPTQVSDTKKKELPVSQTPSASNVPEAGAAK